MKKLFTLLLALCMIITCCSAEMILPGLSNVFGVDMPSLRHTALVDPVSEAKLDDGGVQLKFEGITEDMFNAYSVYLSEFGCALADYSIDGSVMTAQIAKEGAAFTFVYDYASLKAVVTYPAGTNEEKVDIETLRLASLVGSFITLGSYPQGANGEVKPAEWQVLDVQDGKALVISRYGLDTQPYNTDWGDVTWETCTLRKWLNGEFINKAFTPDEQKRILTTAVDNSASQCYSGWSTTGGNNTQDKVFLLSYAEANKYFGVENWQNAGATDNLVSRVEPTAYAVKQGAYTSSSYKTADGKPAGYWWLRSPGYLNTSAIIVYRDGSLSFSGVGNTDVCVRPAFWINLESGIF